MWTNSFEIMIYSTSEKLDALVGEKFVTNITVTPELVKQFSQLSGDDNPLHMDDAAASLVGFKSRVGHGMIQLMMVSKIVGTQLPIQTPVMHSLSVKWSKPCYIGDQLELTLTVAESHPSVGVLGCKFQMASQTSTIISTGMVQVGVYVGS
jgi:acyl dehydratase